MQTEICPSLQTPTKLRKVDATNLLREIENVLRRNGSKLIDLPRDVVVLDHPKQDVTSAHLKCSIVVTASTRAKNHFDITGKDELDDEEFIKELLLEVVGFDLDTSPQGAALGILWLCLHVQKIQYLTVEDHENYLCLFSEGVVSLRSAAIETEFQHILLPALQKVSEMTPRGLDSELKGVFLSTLNIHDVDDIKENLLALKVKAVNINTPVLSGQVLGWSSSDTIYICSDHKIVRDSLNAIKSNQSLPHAERVIETLVCHEGGHCVVRKRARECGQDPTLFSTPSSGLQNVTSTSKCASLTQCGLETGYILETVVFGAVVDLSKLWGLRRKYPLADFQPHALCRSCCTPGNKFPSLPVLELKDIPTMGFSCSQRLRMFM
jgi:hypothetical protein